VYENKFILYDTGDFVDDYRVDPMFRNDHSFFFRVEADENGVNKLKLFPVLISDYQVNLGSNDAKWSWQRMRYLSEKFGTKFTEAGEVVLK
jgi:poly-gamma-glutamate synthesis protein (capsule biosynthesis protein)